MIMQNYMNAVPGDPNMTPEWLQRLSQMGYDVSAMLPPFSPTIEGMAQGIGNPGYREGPDFGRIGLDMPGGAGWDGANAKLAWLAARAQQGRRERKMMGGAPQLPMGHPGMGSSSDMERFPKGQGVNLWQQLGRSLGFK